MSPEPESSVTVSSSTVPARERILDAAEALFAAGGLEHMALRAITTRARVNLAAVHYHFGSKEGLVIELVSRRFEPINRERLMRLDAAIAQASPTPPSLESIVDAFLQPVLRLDDTLPPVRASAVRNFIGRVIFLPPEMAEAVYRETFASVAARFHAALASALPGLPPEIVSLRMHLAVGPLARVLVQGNRPMHTGPAAESGIAIGRTHAELRSFICAGLRAPLDGAL